MGLSLPWKINTAPQRHAFASSSLVSMPVTAKNSLQIPTSGAQWQQKAWEYYDVVPEMRLVVDYRAAAMSKASLQIRKHVPDDSQFVNNPQTEEVRNGLFGGIDHHSSALHRITEHLTVVGETYILITPTQGRVGDEWMILPPDAVDLTHVRNGAGYATITDLEGVERRITIGDQSNNLIRLWDPHPRKYWEANGPTRGALATLDTITHLNALIKSSTVSRLIGGGIYPIPLEAQLPLPTLSDSADNAYDKFRQDLYDGAAASIINPASPAAHMPMIMHMPAESIKAMKDKPIDFYTAFDKELNELRNEEVRRYASGQPLPTEMVVGLGSVNHWCYDSQAQALTRDGWRNHDQITVGTEILTLDTTTSHSVWQPVEFVYRAEVVDEPMVSITMRAHDSVSTLAHRWPVERVSTGEQVWTTTAELNQNMRIRTATLNVALPQVAKYTDAFVELAAWLCIDGKLSVDKGRITQSHSRNPERVQRIRVALNTEFPGQYRESQLASNTGFGGPVTHFWLNADVADSFISVYASALPTMAFIDQMTLAQLELFLHVWELAGRRHDQQGHHDVWKKNREALVPYEYAALCAGRSVITRECGDGWSTTLSDKVYTRPVKALAAAKAIPQQKLYTGIIWCPQTANGTWFARRNGKCHFTGNSSWQLTEHDLKFDIIPLGKLITDALTTRIIVPLLGDDFFLEADFKELITRPDRTPEAIQLYESGIATKTEARELAGLPEIITEDENDNVIEGEIAAGSDTDEQGFKRNPDKPSLIKGRISATSGSRPDPPKRRTTPSAGKPSVVGFSASGDPVRELMVAELLRETGKWMLSRVPRGMRPQMMQVPETERYLQFSGGGEAFSAVVQRIRERYDGFECADSVVAAVSQAVSLGAPVVMEEASWH